MANPNYSLAAQGYTAVKSSLGMTLGGKGFKDQLATLNPLFWLMMRGKTQPNGGRSAGNFNKQDLKSDESGKAWFVTHLLSFDEASQISADSIGKDPGAIPSNFPNYVHLDDFTRARYQAMYWEVPFVLTVADLELIGRGQTNLIDEYYKLGKRRINEALADQIYGSQNASAKYLMGVNYIFSTSNQPGGIDQALKTDWRPGFMNNAASGAITFNILDDYIRRMGYIARSDEASSTPDIVALSTGPTHDLYGAAARSIMATQRVTDTEFRNQFQLDNIVWGNSICYPDPKMPAQSITGLNSNSMYLTGNPEPNMDGGDSENARIVGSRARELIFSGFLCFSVDEIKPMMRVVGHTA